MKHIAIMCMMLCASLSLRAQHSIQLFIKHNETKLPIPGTAASIQSLKRTLIADSAGVMKFAQVPGGIYTISISHIGFKIIDLSLQIGADTSLQVLLTEEAEQNEVVVTSTRTSRTIGDIATRVETISGEELQEKANMKPGDIRMLLNESTGIQTQQTSATSYNSSIRIQGLDGRYTQVLRDGLPLYSGFSGGLSLMQVAPLDLKQIEVIKGSSSTLYGGGAIAGLVNLISKTPGKKRELSFMANGTTAAGVDLSGFYSERYKKTGLTVFGSANAGSPYDPAGIGLTAIPQFERYTLSPRFFIYGNKTNLNIGFTYITETRTGGSMDYIKRGTPGYFEMNNTDRFTTRAEITTVLNNHSRIIFRNSYSRINRLIQVPSYSFKGVQQSGFSEATYHLSLEKTAWVFGVNFLTDDFSEDKQSSPVLRNYHYNTIGAFIQNTWSPVKQFTVETGLRADQVQPFGSSLLPRISLLFKPAPKITMRLGGGLGYKTPTVFNEEAEKIQFQQILPINQNTTRYEKSAGVNFDFNYRTRIGSVGLSLNQLFFYTKLNQPLVLQPTGTGNYQFVNANGHIDTRGMETNLRFTYDDFKLFVGYTYADVNTHYDGIKEWLPLTAQQRLNNVLMYEKEGKLKIGAEAYFFSPQVLSDGTKGNAYWTFGLMGERSWDRFSIFINFENLTDTRQTRFGSIYTGPISNPVFKDIYAPLDGFVANGGIRLRL